MRRVPVTEHISISISSRVGDTLGLSLIGFTDAAPLYYLVEGNREFLAKWLYWVRQTTSGTFEAKRFFLRSRKNSELGLSFDFVISYNHRVCGLVSFKNFTSEGIGEIGYWVGQAFQGLGIVTRSVAALIKWGFESFPELHRIEIRCPEDHAKSRAIPHRLGFFVDGTLRSAIRLGEREYTGAVVYSLLRWEWEHLVGSWEQQEDSLSAGR